RLRVALAPVGSEIAKTLLPLFDDLVKAAQKYGPIAAQVFRENKDDILAAAREMERFVVQVGNLIAKITSLAAPGGFMQIIRELGLMIATLNDLLALDFSGTRTQALAKQFFEEDIRIEDQKRLRNRIVGGSGVRMGEILDFLKEKPPPAPPKPRDTNNDNN